MRSKVSICTILLAVFVLLNACTATPVAPTSTVPATTDLLTVPTTSTVPTLTIPAPEGETIYAVDGDNWEWWSYRNGSAKPISWANKAPDQERTIVWLKIMEDPNYVAIISAEWPDNWSRTDSLVIFNRDDYVTPASITLLDPVTQSVPRYMDNAGISIIGPDVITLFDYSTEPAAINLWSYDTNGVLTKVGSLGPERRGGDTIDCAKNATRPDLVYLSPDGSKVFWRWEYTVGGNCVRPAGEYPHSMFIEYPTAVRQLWEVVDLSGKVLDSGESVEDYSLNFGNNMWPRGWVGNDSILFDSFESFTNLPDRLTFAQCIYVANVTTHSRKRLYCDNDAPPGLDAIKISPDGKHVAFYQDYLDLVIVDTGTGEVTYTSAEERVNQGNEYGFNSALVWSPDSQWVGWTMRTGLGDYINENFVNTIFVTQRDGKDNLTLNNPEAEFETVAYYWLP